MEYFFVDTLYYAIKQPGTFSNMQKFLRRESNVEIRWFDRADLMRTQILKRYIYRLLWMCAGKQQRKCIEIHEFWPELRFSSGESEKWPFMPQKQRSSILNMEILFSMITLITGIPRRGKKRRIRVNDSHLIIQSELKRWWICADEIFQMERRLTADYRGKESVESPCLYLCLS